MNHKSNKTGSILIVFLLLTAFLVLEGCEDFKITQPEVDPLATWSFQTDIQPIFNNNCTSCHGGSRAPDLRVGKSYQSLTNGGYVTLPADKSGLYSKMNSGDHLSRSTETERLKVLYWITQGAKNN